MITIYEFNKICKDALANVRYIFPLMVKYKQDIQRSIIPMLTKEETEDIRNSVQNEDVINKLILVALNLYYQNPNNQTLYCLSMAVGTIIKEFEWGTYYISQEGLYQTATKIIGNTRS